MNNVHNFINQQLGFAKWTTYDTCLRRLRCSKDEEYRGIWGWEDEREFDTPIFACKFSRKQGYENLIALANEDGQLVIHDTDNKEERSGKQIHQNAIFDIDWLCGAFKIITVSGDHTARMVDVGTGTMFMEHMFTGHTRSVKTVAVHKEDPSVFATGSRDGSIRVWDTRSSLSTNLIVSADRTINNSHCRTTPSSSHKKSMGNNVSAANSVTGLVFQNENTLISCGSGDGLIKVWDLRKTYTALKRDPQPKSIIPYPGTTTRNGFSNLSVDPTGIRLYANCLDNTIYSYNISTYDLTPVMEYKGHSNTTFYIKSVISNDGKYLLSGSSDHNAYIWNVKYGEPLVSMQGHTAEVTCVAWRPSGELTLVTCSDDVRHKIWRVGPEVLPENWEVMIRGCTEIVTQVPKNSKRLLEINENTPLSAKRFRFAESNKRKLENTSDSATKRQNTGRRLFDLVPAGKDEDFLAAALEEDEMFKSPRSSGSKKMRLMGVVSPEDSFSPTTNLPNYAVDGSAPHLNFSPKKRRDKDWLTKMRVQNSLIREMQELATGGPTTPKIPKLEERSPRSRPRRRRNSRCSSPQSPILRYFKVTNSSAMKDGRCSPKLPLVQTSSASSVSPQQ